MVCHSLTENIKLSSKTSFKTSSIEFWIRLIFKHSLHSKRKTIYQYLSGFKSVNQMQHCQLKYMSIPDIPSVLISNSRLEAMFLQLETSAFKRLKQSACNVRAIFWCKQTMLNQTTANMQYTCDIGNLRDNETRKLQPSFQQKWHFKKKKALTPNKAITNGKMCRHKSTVN